MNSDVLAESRNGRYSVLWEAVEVRERGGRSREASRGLWGPVWGLDIISVYLAL